MIDHITVYLVIFNKGLPNVRFFRASKNPKNDILTDEKNAVTSKKLERNEPLYNIYNSFRFHPIQISKHQNSFSGCFFFHLEFVSHNSSVFTSAF